MELEAMGHNVQFPPEGLRVLGAQHGIASTTAGDILSSRPEPIRAATTTPQPFMTDALLVRQEVKRSMPKKCLR
jgi:hypothetical protein